MTIFQAFLALGALYAATMTAGMYVLLYRWSADAPDDMEI